jgi:hypothetical protein
MRLNTSLVGDTGFQGYIRTEFMKFLEFNDTVDFSYSLWEASKVILMSKIMYFLQPSKS